MEARGHTTPVTPSASSLPLSRGGFHSSHPPAGAPLPSPIRSGGRVVSALEGGGLLP